MLHNALFHSLWSNILQGTVKKDHEIHELLGQCYDTLPPPPTPSPTHKHLSQQNLETSKQVTIAVIVMKDKHTYTIGLHERMHHDL